MYKKNIKQLLTTQVTHQQLSNFFSKKRNLKKNKLINLIQIENKNKRDKYINKSYKYYINIV